MIGRRSLLLGLLAGLFAGGGGTVEARRRRRTPNAAGTGGGRRRRGLGAGPSYAVPRASGPVYYPNCAAARAAGAAPIRAGEPGYAPRLDRDGDGIACE